MSKIIHKPCFVDGFIIGMQAKGAIIADGIVFSECSKPKKRKRKQRRMTAIISQIKSSARGLCAKRRMTKETQTIHVEFIPLAIAHSLSVRAEQHRHPTNVAICRSPNTMLDACIENKPNKNFILFICFCFRLINYYRCQAIIKSVFLAYKILAWLVRICSKSALCRHQFGNIDDCNGLFVLLCSHREPDFFGIFAKEQVAKTTHKHQ